MSLQSRSRVAKIPVLTSRLSNTASTTSSASAAAPRSVLRVIRYRRGLHVVLGQPALGDEPGQRLLDAVLTRCRAPLVTSVSTTGSPATAHLSDPRPIRPAPTIATCCCHGGSSPRVCLCGYSRAGRSPGVARTISCRSARGGCRRRHAALAGRAIPPGKGGGMGFDLGILVLGGRHPGGADASMMRWVFAPSRPRTGRPDSGPQADLGLLTPVLSRAPRSPGAGARRTCSPSHGLRCSVSRLGPRQLRPAGLRPGRATAPARCWTGPPRAPQER